MQHIKITKTGRDSRLTVGYTYTLERLNNGLLRLTSVGGRFSTLVNPDTSDVEFEYVDAAQSVSPLKGWRNDHAVKLWREVYVQSVVDDYTPDEAARRADWAVEQFMGRWEGTTFLHNVEQAS
uniref:Uncharacterized protein n=1 Tax=feces metagenome TaxID=1861841 RepID=A0A7M2QLV2_9ZZZZ